MAKERLQNKIGLTILFSCAALSLTKNVSADEYRLDLEKCQANCTLTQQDKLKADSTDQFIRLKLSASNFQQEITAPKDMLTKTDETLTVSLQDLNFDGQNDLVISSNKSDQRLNYWLFDLNKNQFEYLGEYPTLKINKIKKQLYSIQHDNGNKQAYQAIYYQLIDGKLSPTTTEKSEATQQSGIFKKSHFQIKNGQPKLIKVEYAYGPSGI